MIREERETRATTAMFEPFSSPLGKEKDVPTKRITNARIVAIESVTPPVLATLVATRLMSLDNSRSLYTGFRPPADNPAHISYTQANTAWFKPDNARLAIGETDDSSALASFISCSGVDPEHPEIAFDAQREITFERTAKTLRVKAECLIEYDMNEQDENSEPSAAVLAVMKENGGGDVGGDYDFGDDIDEDELYGRPSTKRAKIEETPKVVQRARKMKQARICGVWPLLSPCVRLDIIVKTTTLTGDNQRFDATQIVPHFAAKATGGDRVTLGDFYLMVRHAAGFHENLANTVFRSLFPCLYAADATVAATHTSGTCMRTLRAPESVDRESVVDKHAYTVELVELIGALNHNTSTNMYRICCMDGNLFPALATMFLYPRAVDAIIEHYGSRRWQDIVARGPALVQHLYTLMRARPHILCFTRMLYTECCLAQKLTREADDDLGELASKERAEIVEAKRDIDVAALRWLATLPELSINNYRSLITHGIKTSSTGTPSPDEMRAIIGTAIDIYANIIRHDLLAGSDYEHPHKRRCRGATSGHTFSVFGAGGTKPVPSEKYDSGYSDGTLSLDVFFRNLRHHRAKEARRRAEAAKTPEVSTPHSANENAMQIDDFIPVSLPKKRTTLALSPANRGSSASNTTPYPLPDDLSEDITRLAFPCSSEQFCYALRWLCEQSILVTFSSVGTGPVNAGRQFDMFYTSEMWSTQLTLCATLSDIYRRALIERVHCVQRPTSQHRRSVENFNLQLAFRERARSYLRAIIRAEQGRRANIETLRRAAEVEVTNVHSHIGRRDAAINDSGPLEAIAHLRAEIDAFMRTQPSLGALDERDAYADMLLPSEARLACDDEAMIEERLVSSKLSDEQKAGVRHVLHNGITIFMSPGGCGKTFTVSCIAKCFPLDQIAVCALTGKACEVLLKHVGKVSTIHSLLVRETLHRQTLARHEATMITLKRHAREAATSYDSKTLQEEFVRQQCELEREIGIVESRSPLANVRLLIVDETSLIDEQLMRRLFECLHPIGDKQPGRRALMRVLFLGDCDQLGSIEPGSLLQTLCRAFPQCVCTFNKNFRSRGTAIFKLARQIVARDARALDVDFDMYRNEKRLMRSALPENDSPEEIAAAEDASLVFITSNDRALQGDLRRTLTYLGAHTRLPPTPDVLAIRDGIHVIAPTNVLVSQCNTFVRELYFGQPLPGDDRNRYALAQKHLYFKVLRTDRIYFRKNRKYDVDVEKAALIEAAEYEALSSKSPNASSERERARLLALASVGTDAGGSASDAVDTLENAPQAMITQQGVEAVKYLDNSMQTVGMSLNKDDSTRKVIINFYNSEILTVVDLYNTPRATPRAKMLCVCGACKPPPPPPPRKPGEPLTTPIAIKPGPCVRWPHVVPPARRLLGDLSPTAAVHYHDQNLASSASTQFNRIAVFRTMAGAFKQIDVGREMLERSAWEFAHATTIHRFQGSGSRVIIIAVPRDSTFADLCMLYTALTRAEERVVFIGSPQTWHNMVKREPPLRRTELWFMLAQAIAKVHTQVAELTGLQSTDGRALANALGVQDENECMLLNTNRKPAVDDRIPLWRCYERIRAKHNTTTTN